jgi:hypothetical protein
LRVAFARARQAFGAPGVVGCALLIAGLVWLGVAWRGHVAAPTAPVTATSALSTPPAQVAAPRPQPALLPAADDMPRLLLRLERAATSAGLGWPRADYRVNAASAEWPASVEVRFSLNGTYPALRRFVTALLQDTPTLTIKEFALSRSSTEAPEVEAKLAVVIYVAEAARSTRP